MVRGGHPIRGVGGEAVNEPNGNWDSWTIEILQTELLNVTNFKFSRTPFFPIRQL